MSSQKKLLASIARTEMEFQCEMMNLSRHKGYFNRLAKKNDLIPILALVPAFYIGWYAAKIPKKSGWLLSLAQFLLRFPLIQG